MRRMNVALVGCGGISNGHMTEGYAVLPDQFAVVACCDVSIDRARAFAERHGVARAVTRLDDILAMDDVEVIDICTPPMLHGDMVEAALRARKHAICEKPFTDSLARLDEIATLEAQSSARVMPIFQYRFADNHMRVRQAIQSGLAGRAFLSSVETMWLRQSDYYEIQWRGKFATELGGVLLTQSIHLHDLLLWLMGPVDAVAGFKTTRVNPIEVEDCAAIALRMADGSLATLSCTLGSVKEISRIRLVFENATFECLAQDRDVSNPGKAQWRVFPKTPEIGAAIDAEMDAAPHVPSRFAGQFAAFHEAIETGGAFPVTLADARRSLELISAMFHAHETGTTVSLPIGHDHPTYRGWMPAPVTPALS